MVPKYQRCLDTCSSVRASQNNTLAFLTRNGLGLAQVVWVRRHRSDIKNLEKVEEESEEEETNQTVVTYIEQPNRYYLIDPFLRPAICSILIG